MDEHRYATLEGAGSLRRIALENELGAPVDTVWNAITDVELVKQWWPDWQPGGTIEKREGGRIILGDGSWIDGTIKVWSPPHILEFTWHEHLQSPDAVDWFEPKTRSLLRIDLVSTGDSTTLLNLVQFQPADSAVGGTAGWHHFAGERLKSLLEDGRVIDRPDRFAELKLLYAHGPER